MTQRPSGAAPAALELREVAKSFGSVVALRSGTLELEDGRIHALVGENGAGKSTLVKIIAGPLPPRLGRVPAARRAGRLLVDRRRRRPPASPSSTRSPRSSPTSRSPRTSSWAASRCARSDASTARRCARRRSALFAAARRAHPSGPTRPRPLDRRPADHRDREGDLARRPGAHHGRADRGAERRRGRPPVRRRPRPARRGPRPALHLAPLRRGVRALRHRHRDARRRLHRDVGDRRDRRSTSWCARWSAARSPSSIPKLPAEIGEPLLEVRGLTHRGLLRRHLVRGALPARSSGSPVSSGPDAARSRARSSASTATTPAR